MGAFAADAQLTPTNKMQELGKLIAGVKWDISTLLLL